MPPNPPRDLAKSVVADFDPPNASGYGGSGPGAFSDYIMYMAGVQDTLPAWGLAPRDRDQQLRVFWPTEPILAGAVFSTASRYAGFTWDLSGPDRMVNMYTRILHSSQHGRGWQAFMMPFTIDYLTQDNGAFAEIVRTEDAP